ncbi:MAG: peptidase, partial [Planctomycetota bacterium]
PTPETPKEEKKEEDNSPPPPLQIDLEGIQHRIEPFPLKEANYTQIWAIPGKVLLSHRPILGSLDQSWYNGSEPPAHATLEVFDLQTQKTKTFPFTITHFKATKDGKKLIYQAGYKLRVVDAEPAENDSPTQEPGPESGFLDLNRLKVEVIPEVEWQQMFEEIWRLQLHHFWVEDMSGVDWHQVKKRYRPLLPRVASRSEFSDLIWEMQGELGTSHAYELGGDYRKGPQYKQGFLGAEFRFDPDKQTYRIEKILQGDPWQEDYASPLQRIGVNAKPGDYLIAINGQPLHKDFSPAQALVHQANQEVELTLEQNGQQRTVPVKTTGSEFPIRYRDWVENNRNYVLQKTKNRVGYLHIPDMGPRGYAEFHRYYLAELEKDALIVDVRYNRGGHVSQLLLEKLARKRLGFDLPRWGQPEPYPADSVLGPLVAITNEYAGSDGDIFSHCFKLMKLGKLVGKRTWGGVIGIWPRHKLVDGSITTQPEFSFWFVDVGWKVENHGADPDVEVEITPQDWAQYKDPQLDAAIEILLKELEENPPQLPKFDNKPNLALPFS